MQNANQTNLPTPLVPVKRMLGGMLFLSLFTLTVLTGCGGGADSQSKPTSGNEDEPPTYTGSLNSDDVRAFKQELWEKLSPASVCGRCHRSDADPGSRQTPYFVDWLDVNFAYDVVVDGNLVNLANPADSVLVQRVAGGHQCWLATTSQCEAAMISYIEAWANGSKKGETSDEFQINPLNDAQIRDPSESLFFPVNAPASYFTDNPDDSPNRSIHTLVTTYCSACHVSTAQNAQTPYFAEADIVASYKAIKTVVNLNAPTNSRVYERLLANHNCWDDCPTNAEEMLQAIKNLAKSITQAGYPADAAVSKALTMIEGTIASSHNRYQSDQIALYEFKNGSTNSDSDTINDSSGVDPEINLKLLDNNHRWLSNWGIEFTRSRGASASVEDSRKLYNLIRLTGEYSLEAWVIPANVNQENATIVAYSGGSEERNFALGQTMYNYDFYLRSSTLGVDGSPKLMTNDDDEDLQATLQHVVITYRKDAGRRIYVNGVFTDDEDLEAKGDLLNWHPSYVLSFGNELSNNRAWDGILRMVAIHDRALTPEQIQQNYTAEVGQKFQVPFNISHLLNDGVPHSYVVYEVSQFDEFSYLFRNPRFINIDPDSPEYVPPAVKLSGIRIGMNGQDVSVGQAYVNVSIEDISQSYSNKTGLILSEIDTVLQIQNGTTDEFFLTFEQLGDRVYNFIENDQTVIPPLPIVTDENKPADIGVRTFDEINASMARMAEIADWQDVTDINRVFTTYRQQLPAVENIETFLSSHQMAIAQLAMSYCNELVIRDEANTNKYFTGFAYSSVLTAFDTAAERNQIINPLLQKMLNATNTATDHVDQNLQTQPSVIDVRTELDLLIAGNGTDRPGMIPGTCSGAECIDRTRQIIKASCAAVLGSATMLIQ